VKSNTTSSKNVGHMTLVSGNYKSSKAVLGGNDVVKAEWGE